MSYSGQGTPWDGGPPGAEADYANHTSQMYRPHQDLSTSQSNIWPDSVQSYGQYPTGYSYTDTYQSNSQYATQSSSYIYGPTAPAYYLQQTADHIPVYSKTYTESPYEQVSRPFDKNETNYQRPRRSRSRSPYDSRYTSSRRNRSPRQRSINLSPDRRTNRHTRLHKSPSNERFKSRKSRERSESNQSRDRSHSESVLKKSSLRRSFSKSSSSTLSSKSACSSRENSPRSRKYRSPSNSSKRSDKSAKINKKTKSITRSPSPRSGRYKKMRSRSGSSASSRDVSSSEKKYKRVDKSYAYYNSSTSGSNNDSDSSEVSDKSSESRKKRSPKRSSSPIVGRNYKNPRRSYSRNRDRSNSYNDYSHERKAKRTSIRRGTRSRERSSSASYNKRERTPRRDSSGYKDKVASVKDRPKRGEYSPESYRSRSPSHSRYYRGREISRSRSMSKRYRNLRSPSSSRQLKYREKSPGRSSYDSCKTNATNKKTQSYPRKSRSSSPDEKKHARKSRSRSKSSVPIKNDIKILQSDNKTELDSDKSDTEVKSPPLEESGFNFENLPPPDEKMFLKSKPDLRAELEKHLKMHNKANVRDQLITNTISVPQFKNDGSFLEMFKKMQETAKTGESSQAVTEEVKTMVIKKPALPFIGKRRGGRVLKTGLVKKAKAIDEQLVDNAPKDAWSLYMQEVKKYRETSCEEERKTRPLVK